MITKVLYFLMTLLLYVILFVIWCKFSYVIKMTSVVENVLNDNEFFANAVDMPKQRFEQQRKRKWLEGAISKENMH